MVNKLILIGNVGKDPEIKSLEWGKVASFSLATTESWKDKNTGEKKSKTQWHNIRVSGNLCSVVERFIKKGSKIYIEGSIEYRSWEHDGVTKYATDINCRNLTMLGSQDSTSQEPTTNDTDDLPF